MKKLYVWGLLVCLFGTMSGCATTTPLSNNELRYNRAMQLYKAGKYAEAMPTFVELADLGYPGAQYQVGLAYDYGEGVPQNDAIAFYRYQQAKTSGVAHAMYHLGIFYYEGRATARDVDEAYRLWRRAAEAGVPQAQYNIADHYFSKNNLLAAIKWLTKSAEQGFSLAQYNLAVSYYQGLGVQKDYAQAVHYYKLAARQEDMRAIYNLALMANAGEGMDKNPAYAEKLLRLAMTLGHKKAAAALEALQKGRL
ncbi:MAG: sel1 repeat family protein [Gammaproteobacteria bacterium]|nr:sel1 repeat family protein [Gammaproteobacteria bacterium]